MLRSRAVLSLCVLALAFLFPAPSHAGFSSEGNDGLPIEPGSPHWPMLMKALTDLAAVNPEAAKGLGEMAGGRINRGIGDNADAAGGITLPDGKPGVEGDRINISEGFLDNANVKPGDPSTWTGSCWNQLLGVLAHEWVHANSSGPMPTTADQSAITDYLWEKPAYEKEMKVLEDLGEPDGFYTAYVIINGQPIPIPVKTRRQYLRQQLEEKRRKALAELKKLLEGLWSMTLPAAATGEFHRPVLGESTAPTLMNWGLDGTVLWGMTATADGGYKHELPLDDTYGRDTVSDLPLGTDHIVTFISGAEGDNGVVLGFELNGLEFVGEVLNLQLPGCLPESISYRSSDASLWILDSEGERVLLVEDTNADGIPDTLAPDPYASAGDFPELADAHEIIAYLDHPGVAICGMSFRPFDLVPYREDITFLLDNDSDDIADAATLACYGEFVRFPPSIVGRPNAGALVCTVFGVVGSDVTIGGCDADGNPSGETLATGAVGPDGFPELTLSRPLLVGEFIRAFDPVNDPDDESPIYQVSPAGTNRPPIPVFAKLQVMNATTPSGAAVTLDASASLDPDGDALTFEWQQLLDCYDPADCPAIGSGATVATTLPMGAHIIRLITSDGDEEVWDYAGAFVAPPVPSFHDVLGPGFEDEGVEAHWAFWEVEACAAAGIAGGYNDGFYQPAWTVSRDQMAVFISRALTGGLAVPTGPAEATFDDVPTGYWAYDDIEYAVANNIVEGYGDGNYHPDWAVTRGQMAVFIARAIVTPTGEAGLADYVPPVTPSFLDIPFGYWCYDHVEYLAEHDIVGAYPDGSYQPTWTVSRDQMAVFITRAFNLTL